MREVVGRGMVPDWSLTARSHERRRSRRDGRRRMPAGIDVLDIGERHLLAVWRDDLDVEHIRLYEILRFPAEGTSPAPVEGVRYP